MGISEARKKANKKYNDNNYKRFSVMLRNDLADKFDAYCNKNGLSKNGAITKLIEKAVEDE